MNDNSRARVLNVNDHVVARYTISRLLSRAGFEVVEAGSGEAALEIARGATPPDVIVLDVKLPGIDGFEVCRLLKTDAETAAIKVLHTSAAYVTSEKKVEGWSVGADGYLTQPYDPEELIAMIRALLRLRAAERALVDRARELAEADRRKDEFLAMLGHELRNPLAGIRTALPVLRSCPPTGSAGLRALDVVDRQSLQLGRLVDDLLEVSRVTRGTIDLRRTDVELRALARHVVGVVRDRTPERDLRVLEGEPIWVYADPARVEQILVNLVENAIKHTARGGRIEVEVVPGRARRDGLCELLVRDDGRGIAPEALPQLFQTFFQAAPTIDRRAGGLGLGLAVVKHLTELHGGSVTARSDGLGRGAEFVVRLPEASREAARAG